MKFLSTVFAAWLTIASFAQGKLEVLGHSPDLYVEHITASGETLQSIGNRYSLPAAKIASYNSIDPTANPSKGSRIRIPLTKDNFSQVKIDNALPVYHLVSKGDNLYRISIAYNKVSTASIRDWNNLKTEVVNNGQALIVGFIPTHGSVAADKKDAKAKIDPPVVTPDPSVAPDKKAADKPVVTKPAKKDSTTPAKPLANETKKTFEPSNGYSPKDGDEGYFAGAYPQKNNSQLKQFRSGDAATFKTVSGWTDRKYYILMNDAEVGTIVRITGPNNKNICAKVLGPLQETKTGNGLLLRMSNAAAAALGITDSKFSVAVTYFE